MNRSRRGAARVSVVWMIVVVVAFFVSLGVAFVGFDEASKQREERESLAQRLSEAEQRADVERTQVRSISEVAGFYDAESASPRAESDAMKAGLTTLRESFPDMDPSIRTFQKAVPVVISAYAARGTRIRDLETQIANAQSELAAKDKALRDLATEKDRELAKLRSDLQDAEQARNDLAANYERQLAGTKADVSDRDSKWRSTQSELDAQRRKFDKERETAKQRMAEMSSKLQFLAEPEAADARVLAVSKDLGLGWIDIGSDQRLGRGMRFRVVAGAVGSEKVKAWAEVTRVEPRMAEVRFFERSDPFDPPVAGDVVYNPIFDPHGQRNAVLVGRFSGTFNEAQLGALLERIGIHVQPAIDLTTDYLIVGQELYVDPETLEPLEEPLQPSELAAYKDAVAAGLAIVPLKEVRRYFAP